MGGRSTPRLIADAFGLYRRYPLLFLVLAAAVIVPYHLIELALRGAGGFERPDSNLAIEMPLSLFYLVVVFPVVSALHIHAVSDVQRGDEPRLLPIARRGLAALPEVSAATIMAWLGVVGGLLLLIVPGVILFIRWCVAAQVAAIEHEGWSIALRRSRSLTEGHWVHVLAFLVCITLITGAPSFLLGLAFRGESTGAASFLGATALDVVMTSFTALATALLYYDLRTRRVALAAETIAASERAAAPLPREERE